MKNQIKHILSQSVKVKQALVDDENMQAHIEQIVNICVNALAADHKLWLCGNGGSAADSQHIAAEFTGRFYKDRPSLFAEALHVNSSYMTAVANDYSYEEVYARMIQGKGRKGDVLFGLSTSGNSANVVRAFEKAKSLELTTVAFTGEKGGKLEALADYIIKIPSSDTPRIQESHILIGHIICELVEAKLFP